MKLIKGHINSSRSLMLYLRLLSTMLKIIALDIPLYYDKHPSYTLYDNFYIMLLELKSQCIYNCN